MKLYQAIAQSLDWQSRATGEWQDRAYDQLKQRIDCLPHGSGIDSTYDIDEIIGDSKPNRIVIKFGFHCMNDGGYYDGWRHYKLIITPDLINGANIRIVGPDYKNTQLKSYLYECFETALAEEYTEND